MSIRGIDAQMMVTRAPEFLQSANSQLKGAERMQDVISAQNQSTVEREKVSVAKTDKSPEIELHLGDDGGNGGEAYTSQQNEEQVLEKYDELLNADVGPSEHILDITL